jgi:hypothetical protein
MRGFIVYADTADVFIRTQQIHIINTEKISLIIRGWNIVKERQNLLILPSAIYRVYGLLFLKLGLS